MGNKGRFAVPESITNIGEHVGNTFPVHGTVPRCFVVPRPKQPCQVPSRRSTNLVCPQWSSAIGTNNGWNAGQSSTRNCRISNASTIGIGVYREESGGREHHGPCRPPGPTCRISAGNGLPKAVTTADSSVSLAGGRMLAAVAGAWWLSHSTMLRQNPST